MTTVTKELKLMFLATRIVLHIMKIVVLNVLLGLVTRDIISLAAPVLILVITEQPSVFLVMLIALLIIRIVRQNVLLGLVIRDIINQVIIAKSNVYRNQMKAGVLTEQNLVLMDVVEQELVVKQNVK